MEKYPSAMYSSGWPMGMLVDLALNVLIDYKLPSLKVHSIFPWYGALDYLK